MNYQKIYDSLIVHAQLRTLVGYKERHHILPKCLGGTDDKFNLVDLTPGEHYLAHQLLVKIHPDSSKLVYAAMNMARIANSPGRVTNKLFGWLRERHSSFMKGRKLSENHLAAIKKPKSEEHKRKIGIANKGKTLGIPRGPQSEEHRRKLSEARARAWAIKKMQKEN
jgi:hypothetical protein